MFAKKLQGGRKTRKAKIKRVKTLGKGWEGTVNLVEVTVKSKTGRKKTIELAEKKFDIHGIGGHGRNFGFPKAQFNLMQKLIELNRKKELGLRLPTTIRLRKTITGRRRLLQTKFNEYKGKRPDEYYLDRKRQKSILLENGYTCGIDAFMPVKLENSGKVVAVIVDFGYIQKI